MTDVISTLQHGFMLHINWLNWHLV